MHTSPPLSQIKNHNHTQTPTNTHKQTIKQDKVPAGMQPLVHFAPRPVKHSRLVSALLRCAMLLRTAAMPQSISLHTSTPLQDVASMCFDGGWGWSLMVVEVGTVKVVVCFGMGVFVQHMHNIHCTTHAMYTSRPFFFPHPLLLSHTHSHTLSLSLTHTHKHAQTQVHLPQQVVVAHPTQPPTAPLSCLWSNANDTWPPYQKACAV